MVIDISAIFTAHQEGLLVGPSLCSFNASIETARAVGLCIEPIIVLDRCDALTSSLFKRGADDYGYKIIANDDGDPGLSRNRGIQESRGNFVTFLDGDDLWSANWLTKSYEFCRKSDYPIIGHSECNLVFGGDHHIWIHVDSNASYFEYDYLRVNNYWDAMTFAAREIYLTHPFKKNDLSAGFGHEDWHWNCVTVEHGIAHRPVPGTLHAKRRRPGSQSARCAESDVVIWPTPLSTYSWSPQV